MSDGVLAGSVMKSEMAEQPAVLARMVERASELSAIIRGVVGEQLAGVTFLGRGSSGNVGIFGRYVTEMATNKPASVIPPSLLTRYGSTPDYRGHLVIALSQSGMTAEIVESCKILRFECGAKVIGITNNAHADLALAVDACISLDAGEEKAIPATKTVTAQMLALLIVASTLGQLESLTGGVGQQLPQLVAEVLSDVESPEALVERWIGYDRLVITSRGLAYSAALESSLKLKESALLYCQGLSTGDLRHGALASVSRSTPVLGIAPSGTVGADVHRLLEDFAKNGVPVGFCAPSKEADLPLPTGTGEAIETILAVVRAQQLALFWTVRLGLNPDKPALLSKVTQGT